MGHPKKRIMYITPESLTGNNSKWMPIIRVAYRNGQLRRLVIDEAHCITVCLGEISAADFDFELADHQEWGTTFRGSYRSLGEFRREFPSVPISVSYVIGCTHLGLKLTPQAFTASANKWTRSEIAQTLGMDKTNFDMWVLPVNRSNIYYEVSHYSSNSEMARQAELSGRIPQLRTQLHSYRRIRHLVDPQTCSRLERTESRQWHCDRYRDGHRVLQANRAGESIVVTAHLA
jgi:superfamily II DNA helicase RecQ